MTKKNWNPGILFVLRIYLCCWRGQRSLPFTILIVQGNVNVNNWLHSSIRGLCRVRRPGEPHPENVSYIPSLGVHNEKSSSVYFTAKWLHQKICPGSVTNVWTLCDWLQGAAAARKLADSVARGNAGESKGGKGAAAPDAAGEDAGGKVRFGFKTAFPCSSFRNKTTRLHQLVDHELPCPIVKRSHHIKLKASPVSTYNVLGANKRNWYRTSVSQYNSPWDLSRVQHQCAGMVYSTHDFGWWLRKCIFMAVGYSLSWSLGLWLRVMVDTF